MTVHFGLATKGQFNLFLIVGCFVVTGAIGGYLQSYDLAFVAGIVLSLFLW